MINMVPAKFKVGDMVDYLFGSKCRITDMCYKQKSWRYKVESLDPNSKINEDVWINETQLVFHYDLPTGSKDYTPRNDTCPKCDSKWSISGWGLKKYYDCPKCKKPAEELESPPPFKGYSSWWDS